MQKKKDDRDRSPDRRNQRNDRAGRGPDRYDARDQGRRGRDDYRPGGRNHSPRRDDPYGRDRNQYGASSTRRHHDRSRSPKRHSRYDGEQYRQRSRSTHRRRQSDADRLDVPRRYGDQVPDVQLLLLHEVEREFVAWVQQAFHERGLKSDVMFLNPRFPQDAVLQRQILEGVHGIIELDARAQSIGKIPLKVFDRSAGINNVRFDQYQDLDPKIVAELVYRTKTQVAAPSHQPPPPTHPAYPPAPYGQPYQLSGQPGGYPYTNALPSAPPQAPAVQDLAGLVGQLDPSALQAVLASLQAGQGTAAPAAPHQPAFIPPVAAPNPQPDLSAILGSLNGAMAGPTPPPQPAPANLASYGANHAAYPPHPAGGSNPISPTNGGPPQTIPNNDIDTAQQVQSIMATLARYRQ